MQPATSMVDGYAAKPRRDARKGPRIYATRRSPVNESSGTLPAPGR